VTEVERLNGEQRTLEIARMLGGADSEAAVRHAEELLKAHNRDRDR